MENEPNDVQNLQTTYQWKAQETRNTSVPSPWSKGCGGGRKTRSNNRPNLFLSYLSNSDESGEKDHGNEFRGSKNGGNELWGDLKWPEMAKKSRNARLPTVAAAAASPTRSRRVRRWLAVKFHGRLCLDVLLPSVRHVYSDSGRWCLVWSNLPWLANGQNDPTRVHKFWRASLGFWSSKWCFGG